MKTPGYLPVLGPLHCPGCSGSRKAPRKVLSLTSPQAEAPQDPPRVLEGYPTSMGKAEARVPSNTTVSRPGEIS